MFSKIFLTILIVLISGNVLSNDLDKYMKAGMEYVKETRLASENNKTNDIELAHNNFQNKSWPLITSAKIWNYQIKENYGLIFNYQDEVYPSNGVKFKPVTNPSVTIQDGHIIFRYWDKNSKGNSTSLNYRVEFKDEI